MYHRRLYYFISKGLALFLITRYQSSSTLHRFYIYLSSNRLLYYASRTTIGFTIHTTIKGLFFMQPNKARQIRIKTHTIQLLYFLPLMLKSTWLSSHYPNQKWDVWCHHPSYRELGTSSNPSVTGTFILTGNRYSHVLIMIDEIILYSPRVLFILGQLCGLHLTHCAFGRTAFDFEQASFP